MKKKKNRENILITEFPSSKAKGICYYNLIRVTKKIINMTKEEKIREKTSKAKLSIDTLK